LGAVNEADANVGDEPLDVELSATVCGGPEEPEIGGDSEELWR
jgi:hypothetical protein